MQSCKSSRSANLLDKISWHLREEKVISWWTHQLHEIHQLERVLSRRQVHKVCRNTKLCHGVRLNSTLTLHTPKHQALHTVKPSEIAGYSKHQALHTGKHSKTLRNGRIQQIPSPAHKHIGKPSGKAGHSQTPSPAHSQTHRQTLRNGRTQSNTKPCTQSNTQANSQGRQDTVKHQAHSQAYRQTLWDGSIQQTTSYGCA